ncbi:MAG: glycosyl hydrolase family 18 protein [Thermomicrobium sp.]|nr:glycosyl hydrolase family 18 protein [Thermomicrobium sp.]
MRTSQPSVLARLVIVFALTASALGSAGPPAQAAPPFVRWGYYVTYDRTSWTSLHAHLGTLDLVSPYFFQLRADGTIEELSDPTADAFLRQSGLPIVPMIKNVPRWDEFTPLLADPQQRAAIIGRIVDLVTRRGYSGIHIDFEAVNARDAPHLTAFMRELAAQLRPRGKLVTQAVIARTSDTPTTWGGAYDYPALAEVNDYIVVMAYDFHSAGGSPGPVAPLTWVQRVVSYLTTRVPPDRLILGIPLYGYDWNRTAGPPARSVRFDQVRELLRRPGTTSGYDQTEHEAWLRYTDDQGNQHEVWYADVRSVTARLSLALDRGLAGAAFWRLGHEDPAIWDELGRLKTPATRIPAFQSSPERRYFPETGHSLSYGFKAFWERSGGLPVFGYPLTEEFSENNPDLGRPLTVQYFERQRFEYHPELAGTPYEVQLGRLGAEDARRRGLLATEPFQPVPPSAAEPGCLYFPETGHTLCDPFLSYWQSHGLELGDRGISFRESLALFGYPISEPFRDPATGLMVQYFERARFEYHPNNPEPYRVLLGLLGTDLVRAKGWIR